MKHLIDRIILAPERRSLVPFSNMQIWRMEQVGRFPQRIKLGPNRVGWSLEEITSWINARKSERVQTPIRTCATEIEPACKS
jgi:prophage regulatory protein